MNIRSLLLLIFIFSSCASSQTQIELLDKKYPDSYSRFLCPSYNKIGFIGQDGKLLTKAKFDKARAFKKGIAKVCIGCNSKGQNGLWGAINSNGKYKINLKYKTEEEVNQLLKKYKEE